MYDEVSQSTRNKTVSSIWTLAYTGQQYNHWVAFLEVNSGLSVKVDMTQFEYSEMAVLFLSQKTYAYSAYAAHRRQFATKGNPTVGNILDLIFAADKNNVKLDRYKLSPTGQGCAFWTYRFMERIEEAGYVECGESEVVYDEIQWHWVGGKAENNLGLQNRQGEFM